MLKVLKITHKIRKKLLPHPADDIQSSNTDRDSSSLGSEGLTVLAITADEFQQAHDLEQQKSIQKK